MGTKILIFFLAVILWLFIVSGQNYILEIDIPIDTYEPRDSYMLAIPLPESASVRVSGSGRAILFSSIFNHNSLILDISGISRDETISLKSYFSERNNQIVLSEKVNFLEIVYPDSVNLVIDKRGSRVLPVEFKLEIDPKPGYVQYGINRAEPDYVSVSGPEKLLLEMNSVQTDPLILSDIDYSVSREVNLINKYPEQVKFSPGKVNIVADIDMIGEKVIKDVPVTIRNFPEDMDIQIIPPFVNVRVSGANSLVQKMDIDDIFVHFDYLTQWIPGKQYYRMRVSHSGDVLDILEIAPEKCEVVLLKKDKSDDGK